MRDDLVPRRVVGWREWVALPELGIPEVKAKVDSGAKTSALHVLDMEPYDANGQERVRFRVHPAVEGQETVETTARITEWRVIKDSGGHATNRPIIRTLCHLEDQDWIIDLSLTKRDEMGFRMLLGRDALKHRFVVDPALSYVAGERHEAWSLQPWKEDDPRAQRKRW